MPVLRRRVAGLRMTVRDIMMRGSDRTSRPQPRVAAVILAAGRSVRMGMVNKLLIKLGDKEMVAHVADHVLASLARPVVVVTGHEAPLVQAALGDRPVIIAHNPEFAQGLAGSLRAGVAALPPEIDAALICLGDMPLVGPAVLDRLIAAYAAGDGDICVPTVGRRLGNPILWDRRHFPTFAGLNGDEGARRLLACPGATVVEIEIGDGSIVTDIDTSEDVARMAGCRRA